MTTQQEIIEALDLEQDAFDVVGEQAEQLLHHIYGVRQELIAKYGPQEADRLIDEIFDRMCEEPLCEDVEGWQ